jgi:hypothetical protein
VYASSVRMKGWLASVSKSALDCVLYGSTIEDCRVQGAAAGASGLLFSCYFWVVKRVGLCVHAAAQHARGGTTKDKAWRDGKQCLRAASCI